MDLKKKFTLEHGIYGLIFLGAILLRFWNLGDLPLTEIEANSAFAAHQIASGENLVVEGFQAGYTLLTSMLFFVFSSSGFLARFLPALLGSIFVLSPFLFRKQLGRVAAIVLAVGFAIDPLLVFSSRQASGTMLAVFVLFGLVAAIYNRKPILAGIAAALVLMMGPSSLTGLLVLILTVLILSLLCGEALFEFFAGEDFRTFFITTGTAFLLLSTLFLTEPAGLGWVGTNLWSWFSGWLGGGVELWKVVASVPAYLLLPALFALAGLICAVGTQNRTGIALGLISLLTFLLIMLYPGRQVVDLVWLSILLWIIAAKEIDRIVQTPVEDSRVIIFQFVLTFVAGAFLFLNMASYSRLGTPTLVHHLTALGILAFMLVSTILVMFSWSRPDAKKGFSLGILLLLFLFTISIAWNGNTKLERYVNELWHQNPVIINADLIRETVEEVGLISRGIADEVKVYYQIDSPAFRWIMRDMADAKYISQFNAAAFPDILFTTVEEQEPFLAAAYRGHSFGWQAHSSGTYGIVNNFYKWMLFRDDRPYASQIILWARVDQFPDGEIINSNSTSEIEFEPIPADQGEFGPIIE